ncbi:MAG: DNA translocase FtsK 4TM domain-containing protein [Verrucomicrobiota bacterium]|nr:DNA translocase FtsK 4TM domain-containing protein [Verrucomicrobiota bacterium]
MAGKEAPTRESTKGGANEVLGIGLFALAILFLLALFSYDKGDLLFNGTEVNDPRHNLTGIFGAWLAQGCFLALGVSAYLLPPLTLVFAFGFLINKLEGLRKRWPWALAMILAGSAGLSLYPNLFGGIADQLNTVDAGGYMGMLLNKAIFQHVGTAGATVILLAIYAVSLLYITNFHLKDWLREVWQRWKLRRIDRSQPLAEEEVNLSRKEDELTQRVNELQELQRKLEATQSQVEQTALAAEETVAAAQEDPRIIDLSQPGSRQPGQENESEDQEESVDKSKRQLAAIMFTDIAGYSRMANHDEKAALKLIKKQRRLLKPIVKKFDGEWLKEIGDGLLLSFDSSINAVDCAIAIQEKLRGEPHLDLRIGLHQGDIVRDGKDVLGDGVNIASRIEPYAPIGGVALSEKIQQDLISQPEYDVQLLGEFALEGVDQRVEVYTLNTNSEELEETQLIEPEETLLPPDVVESDEAGPSEELKENLDVAPATSEEVLGVSNPDVDEGTESSVHIAEPVSSTGPLQQPKTRKPKATRVDRGPLIENYNLPPADFLQAPEYNAAPVDSTEELKAQAITIQKTLNQFGVEVALGDITKGPTITRFELHPAPGVKMEKITAYANNITAALEAERINILAPVPGKSTVGVEVPNQVKTKVIMRDLLESDEWKKSKAKIPVALGKDVYGKPMIADLAEMPHLLIAGATGAGKSVCMNSIIASLLYKFSPDELRLVMIDPKVVELQMYNKLPHLVVPVVTDPKKVILALRWVVQEMEKRYKIFAQENVKNVHAFNKRSSNKPKQEAEPELPLFGGGRDRVEAGSEGFAVEVDEEIAVPREEELEIPDKLSYIVVVIDELADLMLTAPADVENAIARITQMARAAGIHCIVATQRPSVKVITGVIKANIPSRIAFQVASKIDSRVILDEMGAEKLLGKGDMLYQPPGAPKPIRAQGPLVEDHEIEKIVDFIAEQGKPSYELEIHKQLSKPMAVLDAAPSDEEEELIQQCIEVIRSEQKASVSKLQRRLRLGYNRAARLMDELEDRGIVGPAQGNEPREILIDLDGTGADGRGQTVHSVV